jgi:hypothetical protein
MGYKKNQEYLCIVQISETPLWIDRFDFTRWGTPPLLNLICTSFDLLSNNFVTYSCTGFIVFGTILWRFYLDEWGDE